MENELDTLENILRILSVAQINTDVAKVSSLGACLQTFENLVRELRAGDICVARSYGLSAEEVQNLVLEAVRLDNNKELENGGDPE